VIDGVNGAAEGVKGTEKFQARLRVLPIQGQTRIGLTGF